MAKLPNQGPISTGMITANFGKDAPDDHMSEYYKGGKFVPGVNTKIPSSGRISKSDFYGARTTEQGALEWGPGTYSVKIPDYAVSLTMEIWAGGGGAWGGAAGKPTTFHSLNANGGAPGGWIFEASIPFAHAGGDGGAGSGGDSNGTGAKGGQGYVYGRDLPAANGKGEAHPARGAGATPGYAINAGNKWHILGGGGGGGWCTKTWNYGDPSAPTPGGTLTLIVGEGGGGDAIGGYAKMDFS